MKKIAVLFLCIMFITGCGKEELLNIPEWMTTGTISKDYCIKNLGIGYEETNTENLFAYVWDDYELLRGYKGTLRTQASYDVDFFAWFWTINVSEKDFNKIYNIIVSSLGDPVINSDNPEKMSYTFNFIKKQNDQSYYPLNLVYENNIVTIGWGYYYNSKEES